MYFNRTLYGKTPLPECLVYCYGLVEVSAIGYNN